MCISHANVSLNVHKLVWCGLHSLHISFSAYFSTWASVKVLLSKNINTKPIVSERLVSRQDLKIISDTILKTFENFFSLNKVPSYNHSINLCSSISVWLTKYTKWMKLNSFVEIKESHKIIERTLVRKKCLLSCQSEFIYCASHHHSDVLSRMIHVELAQRPGHFLILLKMACSRTQIDINIHNLYEAFVFNESIWVVWQPPAHVLYASFNTSAQFDHRPKSLQLQAFPSRLLKTFNFCNSCFGRNQCVFGCKCRQWVHMIYQKNCHFVIALNFT